MTQLSTASGEDGHAQGLRTRTSLLAIFSLIFSLICCVPGLGVLAVLLGVFGLVAIGRSKGRLEGTGLAVSGIVVGVLVSALWIIALLGVRAMLGVYTGAPSRIMMAIESAQADFGEARSGMSTSVSVSDEQFGAFRAAYREQLGAFRGTPQSIAELVQDWTQVGPLMQSYRGQNDAMPVPGRFEKGMGVIVIVFDPSAPPRPGSAMPEPKNIIVLTPDGRSVTLLPEGGGAATAPEPGEKRGEDAGREPAPAAEPGAPHEQPATPAR